MEQKKKRYLVVFDHKEVRKILESLGFKQLGNKTDYFSWYMNNETNVVSYYKQKKYTPENRGGFIFIHKDKKYYAYEVNQIKDVYMSLIKDCFPEDMTIRIETRLKLNEYNIL